MRKIIFFCILIWILPVNAQVNYGLTGLLNMPTADMQAEKTFMMGGNWLNHHTSVPRWWYDTWNYYVNMTFFPWFEFGYLCVGHKSVPIDYGNVAGFWVPRTYGKFVNQDRSFHLKFRLWKEGWWKEWTPQVVFGATDVLGNSWSKTTSSNPAKITYSNGFLNRYYLAFTKHFLFDGVGEIGAHLTWIYSERFDNKLNNPALGVNFRPRLTDKSFVSAWVNRVNMMAELVPGYTEVNENLTFKQDGQKYHFNVGLAYSVWKEYIELTAGIYDGKYFSGGLQFKVHL